eukprot:SAG11_NODE_1308_length_5239_cov_12.108366_1_plen_201_part_10
MLILVRPPQSRIPRSGSGVAPPQTPPVRGARIVEGSWAGAGGRGAEDRTSARGGGGRGAHLVCRREERARLSDQHQLPGRRLLHHQRRLGRHDSRGLHRTDHLVRTRVTGLDVGGHARHVLQPVAVGAVDAPHDLDRAIECVRKSFAIAGEPRRDGDDRNTILFDLSRFLHRIYEHKFCSYPGTYRYLVPVLSTREGQIMQ